MAYSNSIVSSFVVPSHSSSINIHQNHIFSSSLSLSKDDDNAPGGNNVNGESSNDPMATLLEIPEFAELLQSKKMRECMETLATGGPEALELKMKEDPEVEEIAVMLKQIMEGTQEE